jgi:hypothetical protein
MALWRFVVKNSGNAACKDKRQRLEKGMFIETSTISPIPPIGVARERPMLAQLFLKKYGIEVYVNNMISIVKRLDNLRKTGILRVHL